MQRGEHVTFEDVLSDMIKRDNNDTTRECAPLAAADDAIIVDSGSITFDETVDKIINIIKDKVGE